jgi:hypothetical protein
MMRNFRERDLETDCMWPHPLNSVPQICTNIS